MWLDVSQKSLSHYILKCALDGVDTGFEVWGMVWKFRDFSSLSNLVWSLSSGA